MTDLGQLLDVMIARIETVRAPVESRIERALRSVPRHEYVPPLVLIAEDDRPPFVIDRDTDPDRWLRSVYTETALVTQLDDGATDLRDMDGSYSSSSSAPATVADLLELLDPRPGDRVLEVGTGTGWTAALLCHLAGEQNVTSVEVDPSIGEAAAKNLAAAGLRPHLVVGDGAEGVAGRAPFDRVHVTCAVRTVPYAWVEQCRLGAVIVTPMRMGVGDGHVLRLVVLPDGTAQGGFREYASYMSYSRLADAYDDPALRPPWDDDRDEDEEMSTLEASAWSEMRNLPPMPAAWFAEPTPAELPPGSGGVHYAAGRIYGWVAQRGVPHEAFPAAT
ncbi:methyltransferase domain-containing protein [Nonomuraea sp. NPDC049714]|uniref:methyltransferase domain-containing protein n=1 Tax=Nonomuraea sp. NPDC049714 TaxID=3364357 RepID=UPI0037A20E53